MIALTSGVKNSRETDVQLIEKCIHNISKGDISYLETLYKNTSSAVYGFSLSIVGNPQDAEDILQSTYLKVFETANGYVSQGKPMAWIFTIAKNLSLMKIREHKKTSDIPQEKWDNFLSKSETLSSEDAMILQSTINMLSEEERQIVILHAVCGYKHKEIAEFLSLSLSTTLSKYHRAIKRLQNILKEGMSNE